MNLNQATFFSYLTRACTVALIASLIASCAELEPTAAATPENAPTAPTEQAIAPTSPVAPKAPPAPAAPATPISINAPADWQQGATGLLTVPKDRKSTAGLGFTVWQDKGWPGLSMQGGVEDGTTFQFPNQLIGPTRIDLGVIKVPNATGAFSTERADWAHNEMTFTHGGNTLRAWASRLSPAVLIQSQANALRFLSGDVKGNQQAQNGVVDERGTAPAFPKYAAFPSGGNTQVAALSASNTALNLSSNWLLVWYAANSHFVDTKKALSYPGVPPTSGFQGDVPILLVFQNSPTGIKHGGDGGVELTWSGAAGYVAVLPLFGRDVLRATQTAGWATTLPADVRQRAQTWAGRLCQFPASATESYAFDEAADLVTVTEDISFIQVCGGGTRFAPLPPMLALAKDALGLTFSGSVIDGGLATEFGPMFGIENVQQYSWKMAGLKTYADARRELGTNAIPASTTVEQELTEQVSKTVAAGHLRPWTFMDGVPRHTSRGDLYWANPADILYPLIEVADAMTAGAGKQSLVNYIKSERGKYPPEDIFHLNLREGTVRANMQNYALDWDYTWSVGRADAILTRVPLWSYYALSRYYDLTGEAPPSGVLTKASQALDRDMREQDWANLYWFDGFDDRKTAVVNANRHFAGLVGYVRLATKANDANARALGMALLAKATALRVGMAKYPRYLYSAGLNDLPSEADWMVKQTAQVWRGYLFVNNWTGANDDPRQIVKLSQFRVYLHDQSGTDGNNENDCCFTDSHLVAYRDLTPELARLLSDKAKADAEIYARKVKALFPHWFAAFAEGTLGHEHNLSHPVDSYQTFLAEAWLNGTAVNANDLAYYADISWLEFGDLFYMHKLAEAVRAYRGGLWTPSEPALTASMRFQPTGLITKDDKVTIYLDLSSTSGPITTTASAKMDVPPGLSYVDGSLKVTPNNIGTVIEAYSPALSWQGTLPQPATIQFEVIVTEDKLRTFVLTYAVEDKPGRTQTVGLSLPVNLNKGPRVMLPLVRK